MSGEVEEHELLVLEDRLGVRLGASVLLPQRFALDHFHGVERLPLHSKKINCRPLALDSWTFCDDEEEAGEGREGGGGGGQACAQDRAGVRALQAGAYG